MGIPDLERFPLGCSGRPTLLHKPEAQAKVFLRSSFACASGLCGTGRYTQSGTALGAASHGSDAVFPRDRGLLFLCYQTDLERQFEFVQNTWVNNVNFPKPGDGQDPILAQRDAHRTFTLPKGPGTQPAHLKLMTHFVVTTGGDYFFQPSIAAVAGLGKPLSGSGP